jgi:hypothetical protein
MEPEYLYCYGVLLAVIPMHLYNSNTQQKSRKQWEKWAFYIYYPLHIAVIELAVRFNGRLT